MEKNELRDIIEIKEVLFQKNFSLYQKNLRKYPNYIKYDAFKDLKLILELYSEIFHLRGYNYSKFTHEELKKLVHIYSISEKRELIGHLVKALVKNGNDEEAKYVIMLLNKIEIFYYWESIKNLKNIFSNSLKLLHKIISYNLAVLLLFIILYLLFSTLIFCNAKIDFMAVIEVEKINISHFNWLNNLGNLLTYIFDLDDKMQVKPLNFAGVFILSFQKSFLILVIGNYLVKEIFNKIKLQ